MCAKYALLGPDDASDLLFQPDSTAICLESSVPNPARHGRIVPLLCLLGAVLFWGTSFAATKTALDSFTPMTVIWLRMAIATVVFAPAWFFLPKPAYRRGDLKWLSLIALLQPCLYYLAEGYAIRLTTSSAAGVISAIVPLLVAVAPGCSLRSI